MSDDNHMGAPSNRELWQVLEAVMAQEGTEGLQSPDGFSQERTLSVVQELLGRGWIEADAVNRGDGRLLAVRGPRPTALGRSVLADLRRESIGSVGSSTATLSEKKRRRAQIMAALYDFSEGLALRQIALEELAALLDWRVEDTDAVLEYLEHEGLVEFHGFGPQIGITHAGVREVEYAMEHPHETTEHFLPGAVVVVNGDMYSSQIQAGTRDSHQQQNVTLLDQVEAIRGFVDGFRELLDALPEPERAIAAAEIETIDTQLASPQPNAGVLTESLRSLRTVAEGAAGSGVFVGVLELARYLAT